VLRLVAKGLSYKQIAERLVLSHRTVQNHVQNVLGSSSCTTASRQTRYAIEQGPRRRLTAARPCAVPMSTLSARHPRRGAQLLQSRAGSIRCGRCAIS
jgi:hypothetical protein